MALVLSPAFLKLTHLTSVDDWIGEGSCPLRGSVTDSRPRDANQKEGWDGLAWKWLNWEHVTRWVFASSVVNLSVNSEMLSQGETSPTHYRECSCTLGSDSSAIFYKLRNVHFMQAEKHRKLQYGSWRNPYLSEPCSIKSHLGSVDICVKNRAI